VSKSTIKVLLVEDDPLILFSLADHMREEGFEVVETRDASQALEALAEHSDLAAVVTDVHMPGPIDGLELTRIISRLVPKLPVIVASGRATKVDVPPGVMFFPKPYLLEDLSKLVKELV
jgi:two-component system, response regulator PdtaR